MKTPGPHTTHRTPTMGIRPPLKPKWSTRTTTTTPTVTPGPPKQLQPLHTTTPPHNKTIQTLPLHTPLTLMQGMEVTTNARGTEATKDTKVTDRK